MSIWYFSYAILNVSGTMKLVFLDSMKMMVLRMKSEWNGGWRREDVFLQGYRELMETRRQKLHRAILLFCTIYSDIFLSIIKIDF